LSGASTVVAADAGRAGLHPVAPSAGARACFCGARGQCRSADCHRGSCEHCHQSHSCWAKHEALLEGVRAPCSVTSDRDMNVRLSHSSVTRTNAGRAPR
jgi:hypothetical protein